MKKNAKPQLDAKWWSKNKAKTMKKSGLGKALTAFEVAQERTLERGLAPDKITIAALNAVKALSEVKRKVATAVQCCNEKVHAETIAALKKYPKIIQAEEKRLKAMAKEYAAKAKAPKAAPPQKLGSIYTYYEADVAKAVKRIHEPDWLGEFKDFKLSLTLTKDISEVLKREKAVGILNEMVEDAQKVEKKTVSAILQTMYKIDKSCKGKTPEQQTKIIASFKPAVGQAMKAAGKELEQIPKKRWLGFVKIRKEYRDYKIQTGKNIAVGALSLTAGIVGVASTPFTAGAGTVLGLTGIARGAAGLVRNVTDAARKAEQTETVLTNDLKKLREAYIEADGTAKKRQGVQEVTSSVIKGILGTDPVWATLPKCNGNLNTWKSKVKGLKVEAQTCAGEIVDAISECTNVEKVFKGAKDKNAAKVLKKLKKVQTTLDKALKSCEGYQKRVNTALTRMPKIETMLKALNSNNPKFAQIFDKVFPALVNVGLAGAGGGIGVSEAKSSLETFAAISTLTSDLATEIDSHI